MEVDKLLLTITPKKGGPDIEFEVQPLPQSAPAATHAFIDLVLRGFYEGLKVFEVEKNYWWKSGCPNNDGTGTAEFTIPNPIRKLKGETFSYGDIGMCSDGPGTESCQFFIYLHPEQIPAINYGFMKIGKVISNLNMLPAVKLGDKISIKLTT